MSSALQVNVVQIRQLSAVIKEFVLKPVAGTELPAFAPGSHVILDLNINGQLQRNAYSLTSSPFDRSHYRIAVRLQENSRGGSRYLHKQVKQGQVLNISWPKNYFHFEYGASKRLLIAGGIGITPFMPLLACLPWLTVMTEMHYAFRNKDDAVYIGELQQGFEAKLYCYENALGQTLMPEQLLAAQPIGTHVYVCGPESLIDAVRAAAMALGWPDSNIHFEKFSVDSSGEPFRVLLQQGDITIEVAAEESLLEALEKNGIKVRNLCRAGVCGECKTSLLNGDADHRDLFLSDAEKSAGDCIMLCVSRARGDNKLLLDL